MNRTRLMTDEDLDYIYVLIEVDGLQERVPKTIREASDAEFRQWIVPFSNYHGVQILPSFGRIGMDTRLAMINRLIRNGVKIHRQALPEGRPRMR